MDTEWMKEKQIEKVYSTNRNFKEEKNMDLMNELLNCLNSIDYDIFDEDYLDELLDTRDSAPFDTEWCRVDEEIEALKTPNVIQIKMKKNRVK